MSSQVQQTPQPSQAQRTAEAHAAFTGALKSVGSNLDADLRARAANLHENATALSKQEADLKRATNDLARQNDQWQKVADQAREGLKEIGDIQNWAELIERDLLIVEETIKLADEEKKNNNNAQDEDNDDDGEGDGDGDGDRAEFEDGSGTVATANDDDNDGHEEGEEEEIGENGKNMPRKEREGLWSRRWW
jgi:chromosome segregation ATPase